MVATPTTLYRLFDSVGALLYVGIAGNPGRRFEQHAGNKPWWGDVAVVTLEHYPSREAASMAEADAIRAENPRHNVVWAGDAKPPTLAFSQSGKPIEHGGPANYRHYGCTCGLCLKAHRKQQTAENRKRRARLAADPSLAPHGRASTYSNWGCRCDECKAAAYIARRARKFQREQAEALQTG